MSNGTVVRDNWVIVKMTRWENGHNVSSSPLPVKIDVGAENLNIEALYRIIWTHFSDLENDPSSARDRQNLPIGAGPRASDGIEGLSVQWQGGGADGWSVNGETVITKKNLVGVVSQCFSICHCQFSTCVSSLNPLLSLLLQQYGD